MEMILLGTGGCTAYDVVLILHKSNQDISHCEVTLTAKRAEIAPKIFTHIHFHIAIYGRNFKKNIVERAIKLSQDKYCSASLMLKNVVMLTTSFGIIKNINML